MDYEVVQMEGKTITGLCARTGNDAPDCAEVIGGLWGNFMSGVSETIKNVATPHPVALYSDYDETSYDVTIGMEVSDFENPSLTCKAIPAGKYAKFFVKGDVVKDVANAWKEIWNMPLERTFTGDYEQYLSNENGVAEINIFVAIK